MSTVWLFGAGASHAYAGSTGGVRPPLAAGFWRAYGDLVISEDFEVRVGAIVNHVRDVYGIDPASFNLFDQDIEQFMTHLDIQVRYLARMRHENPRMPPEVFWRFMQANDAFNSTLFLVAHVLNEIQNGPVAPVYVNLLEAIDDADTLLTFNWDTLLDRALWWNGNWTVDNGYGVNFESVLESDWRVPIAATPGRQLIKLHGSTNWLVNYISRRLDTGEREMISNRGVASGRVSLVVDPNFTIEGGELRIRPETRLSNRTSIPIPIPPDPDASPVCILRADKPVSTYRNRYRGGYQAFSYFFPPNHPRTDVPLMPLIITPTSFKLYDEFAHIFDRLWDSASDAIEKADRVVVIGYSFPATDVRSLDLLRNRIRMSSRRIEVEVVGPDPDPVIDRIVSLTGTPPDWITRVPLTFGDYVRERL